MENQNEESVINKRLNNILENLSKCKIDCINEKEECKKIRDINSKLEIELRQARELEKSHRFHLLTSREMVENLQETVSQLVYLKRDAKKLKDEINSRDTTILTMEKDKDNILLKHNESILELRIAHERQMQELIEVNERKAQQVQYESDTQIAQFKCVIEELRAKIKEIEIEHKDKMNLVVLEYEEKIQRGVAEIAQLQDQLARQATRTDSNIDAYRRRLEELEEKLKQSQFKQYLAQSTYPSQYESQVERPYSVNRDPYPDSCSVDSDPTLETPKAKAAPVHNFNKAPKSANTLQVMYYGNKTPGVSKTAEKKGQFNITKKRKLYSDKDFQDF